MADNLQTLIRNSIPFVNRPENISLHGESCRECLWTLEELVGETDKVLSERGVRWLLGELGTLSAEGFRWILPSYLMAVVEGDIELGEFLIYHLSTDGNETEESERDHRLGILTAKEIMCILEIINFLKGELGESYYEDIDKAVTTLQNRANHLA